MTALHGIQSGEKMKIFVSCYAGGRGEEIPRFFDIENIRIQIVRILDRWITPEDRFFKVSGDDGFTYVIRHDGNDWYLD